MGNIMLVWVLLMVKAALAEDDLGLMFTSDEIMVKPNEKVNLECGITGTYRYCVWEHGGEIVDTLDVHDNIFPGKMSKPENITDNQCGIVLDRASTKDHGEWTCKVFIKGETLIGIKNVTILVKPTLVELTPAEVITNENQNTNIKCTVNEARPAVQISWLLGDVDITENAHDEDNPVKSDGIFLTVSTLKRNFTAIDNGKELKCVVEHPALDTSEIIISRLVNVLYAPIKNMPQVIYINETNFLEIKVNFSANPKPSSILWQYGKSFENFTSVVEIPFDGEMIQTNLETLENEHYIAVLNISSFNEEELQLQYNLFVENEIGSTNYVVMVEASVDIEADDQFFTIAVVAITSTFVLTIVGALTCIWRNFIQHKNLIIATLPLCQKCCSTSKEDKTDDETGVQKPDVEMPIIVNVVVKDETIGKDDKTEDGDMVGNIVKDVLDKIKITNESENVKNPDV